jgi:hypothetical protein
VRQLPKLDAKKSEEGRWVEYVPGISVLIARAGNRAARDMMTKLGQRKLRRITAGSTEALEAIARQVCAHCIIRGWKGLSLDGKKEEPYTPETALTVLKDPKYADFYEFVQAEAGMDDDYREQSAKEAAGNLQTSSAGS